MKSCADLIGEHSRFLWLHKTKAICLASCTQGPSFLWGWIFLKTLNNLQWLWARVKNSGVLSSTKKTSRTAISTPIFLFLFLLVILFIYISNVIPLPSFPSTNPLNIPSPLALCGCSPTHPLLCQCPNTHLSRVNELPPNQVSSLPLMPDKAILHYICS